MALATLGCAGVREVRYVYQDGESGVIGMPENTSRWPSYYRSHAEELMARHFPEGYEVVRAEEVEKGSRVSTVNGTKSAELDPGVSGKLIALGKLGRTASRTDSDTLKIKECRIIYRKAEPKDLSRAGDYAEQAGWTPLLYVDPNAPARHSPGTKPEGTIDPEVLRQARSAEESNGSRTDWGEAED